MDMKTPVTHKSLRHRQRNAAARKLHSVTRSDDYSRGLTSGRPPNTLLNVNTLSGDEAEVRKKMTAEEEHIYNRVRELVDESVQTLEEDLMKTVSQKIRERDQEFRQRMLSRYSVEERLQGLSPREVLAALTHRLSLDELRKLLQGNINEEPLKA